ncbi:MAG: hypothetical protein K0Q56_161 [Sporolactobacillus laevolacticus]|jgi:EAL domain-containing protein (putative c-di-GMP-specific phosphodiesterase class I)|nr:hypothetical protein [Sporolactobacillus laevolacticus]
MWLVNFLRSENFFHHYQPIVNLKTNNIEGYEALFRSHKFNNPERAYHSAIRKKKLFELDANSIQKAVCTFLCDGPINQDKKLFINVYPSTLLNLNFAPFILQLINYYLIPHQQIVLEIFENESIEDFSALTNVLHQLKSMGLLIAVDDFGKGTDNINRTIEIDSDYIKLDRYFSIGLNGSKKKQAYVDFLVHYCARFNLKLIFEGLETERDIDCAKILGVQYAQGYAIGKPQPISQFM